jgi:hypothetical protein
MLPSGDIRFEKSHCAKDGREKASRSINDKDFMAVCFEQRYK